MRDLEVSGHADGREGTSYRPVVMLGTFPPPTNGASAVNQRVSDRLRAAGVDIYAIDTGRRTASHGLIARSLRVGKLFKAWSRLVRRMMHRTESASVVYLSAAGGLGLLYDIITVGLARIWQCDLIIHHHNWTYVGTRRNLAKSLTWLSGDRATHVVLCEIMGETLRRRYGIQRYHVLSNAAIMGRNIAGRPRDRLGTIGFLSNLTVDKGTLVFLDLARAIEGRGWDDIKLVEAGPCADYALRKELQESADSGLIEWMGALYGQDKDVFWEKVDAFVFPTQYPNEAEPLVVWEALGAGCPVIAHARGCMAEQVGAAGRMVPPDADFCAAAIDQIASWREGSGKLADDSCRALSVAAEASARAELEWGSFKRLFTAPGAGNEAT